MSQQKFDSSPAGTVNTCKDLHHEQAAQKGVKGVSSTPHSSYRYDESMGASGEHSDTLDPKEACPSEEAAVDPAKQNVLKGGNKWVTEEEIRIAYAELRAENGNVPPSGPAIRHRLNDRGSYSTINKYKQQLDEEFAAQSHPQHLLIDVKDKACQALIQALANRVIDEKIEEYESRLREKEAIIVNMVKEHQYENSEYARRCDELAKNISLNNKELVEERKRSAGIEEQRQILSTQLADAKAQINKQQRELDEYGKIKVLLSLLESGETTIKDLLELAKKHKGPNKPKGASHQGQAKCRPEKDVAIAKEGKDKD